MQKNTPLINQRRLFYHQASYLTFTLYEYFFSGTPFKTDLLGLFGKRSSSHFDKTVRQG